MSSEHAIDALTDDERRLMETIEADLDREMAVEPSADFAARVRARISAADRDGGWRFPWALAAAAVLTIATGILFATLRDTPETTGAPARHRRTRRRAAGSERARSRRGNEPDA